jgi:hypothetical protein
MFLSLISLQVCYLLAMSTKITDVLHVWRELAKGQVRLLLFGVAREHHRDPPLVRVQGEDPGHGRVRLRQHEDRVKLDGGGYETMRNPAYTRINVGKKRSSDQQNLCPQTAKRLLSTPLMVQAGFLR